MQPDYIYCKYIIYIAFDNSNKYYLSFGIKFMRVWVFFVQEEKLRGVSVWNVRETGGQESHFGACICPTPALVKVFLVDTIIELCVNDHPRPCPDREFYSSCFGRVMVK